MGAGAEGGRGLCGGAGVATIWKKKAPGKKVTDERAEELISTCASRVHTACPFYYIMVDGGVKGAGAEETVQVADISMHLLEALEAGDADRARQLTTLED